MKERNEIIRVIQQLYTELYFFVNPAPQENNPRKITSVNIEYIPEIEIYEIQTVLK